MRLIQLILYCWFYFTCTILFECNKTFIYLFIYLKDDRLIVNDRKHEYKSKQSEKLNLALGFTKLVTPHEEIGNLDRQGIFHAIFDHVKASSGASIYTNRDVGGRSKKVYVIRAPLRGICTTDVLKEFKIPLKSSNEIEYADVLIDKSNNLFENCHGLVIIPPQSIL